MKGPKRSSKRKAIATLTALSIFTVAISAHNQQPQSTSNVTVIQPSNDHTPHRKPHKIDHTSRTNASPPMLKKANAMTSIQPKEAPQTHMKQSPYYPSLKSTTCLNDNNYPDYYLYDVKSYFFHSPEECCERNFGNSVGTKGGGLLKAGGVAECLAAISGSQTIITGDTTKIMNVRGSLNEQNSKLEHHGNIFPKSPFPYSAFSTTGAEEGEKMSSKMYPKLMNELASKGKADSIEMMSGASYRAAGFDHTKLNQMYGSSAWDSESKISKPPDAEAMIPIGTSKNYLISDKYMMPPKRPPPPELEEYRGWNTGWNQPPPYSDMEHPHSKSGKSKSHKSGKSKSSKSKAGKADAPWWSTGSWWDDYTWTLTNMPTETVEGQNEQNPQISESYEKPSRDKLEGSPEGTPSWDQNRDYTNTAQGKLGPTVPNNRWWSDQQPRPERPKPGYWTGDSKPNWSSSSGSSGKPGGGSQDHWWGGGNKWGSWKPRWEGGHQKPIWGNGWSKGPWGSEWWSGWGDNANQPVQSIQSTKPTPKPTGLFPSDTMQLPTYAPSPSTYSPTSSTYAPTSSTYMPTSATYSPTGGTYMPTSSTYFPTEPRSYMTRDNGAPTQVLSSYAPSTYSPTNEGFSFFFWGNPESIGQESTANVTEPLTIDGDVSFASTGSKYSIVVMMDGLALSSGVIESTADYRGHLGINTDALVEGINSFQIISNVFDKSNMISGAPAFSMIFSGVEITPGSIHTILLDRKGNAYSTGSNSKGQLCLGDDKDRFIPTQIPIEGPIIDVAIGSEHTLLLHEDGTVYVCGSNNVGQIGLGDDVIQINSAVALDISSSILSVSAGAEHSLIMAEDGIYVTGDNSYGQLCSSTIDFLTTPMMIDVQIDNIVSFEASKFSSYILYIDGSLNACGKNDFGQLGDGSTSDMILTEVIIDNVVRLYTSPSSESVFFVTEDETIYSTGLNSWGTLGVGDEVNRAIPAEVKFEEQVLIGALSSSDDHTIAFGLVTGSLTPILSPPTSEPTFSFTLFPTVMPTSNVESTMVPTKLTEVASKFPTRSPSTISTRIPTFSPTAEAGTTVPPTVSTAIVTSSPTEKSGAKTDLLLGWGAQESFGLSVGAVTSPETIERRAIDVSGGSKYSLILMSDGTAQAAGYITSMDDYHGHLGLNGSDISEGSNIFQDISSSFDNDSIVSSPSFTRVFAGVDSEEFPGSIHSFFIDENGQAWATGSNKFGELCLGDDVDRLIPTKVTLDGKVSSVAIGSKHTLILLDDGNVYACGSNNDGQLAIGDPDVSSINTPTKVDSLQDVRMISAGIDSSLFLASDGLFVSGKNEFGQLCVDTNRDSLFEPAPLEGVSANDVASFEAIATSSFILFKDGSVGACGRNNFGQLADGTNEDKTRVVVKPIPDDVPIIRLGVGPSSQSVFFVNENGSVYGTGLNDRGQLGVGDADNRNTLTLVEFSGDFLSNPHLSASGDHTLAR